ncbi:MAG: AbrB/MazE/SpoVT family DNA-binding domain-containing protein [Methylococcaceae bacterium]
MERSISVVTIKLSSKGQIVIPKEIRDQLHWQAGTQLTLVSSVSGVTLKTAPKKTGGNLGDLIGMLRHDGPPVPIEVLCRPVDYRADWEESAKRSQ